MYIDIIKTVVFKTCPRCQKRKDVSEFNWKVKNITRATYCTACSREYVRQHYAENRKYYLEKARRRNVVVREEARQYVGTYLSTHPCVDCGEKDITVLEFDHKDRKHKRCTLSDMVKGGLSLKTISTEIGKCEVRCANCHRRKTAHENNSWKLKYAPVA